jgi:uncharacterized membrane protein
MLKKNKIQIIIASVINFLPTLLGSIFWDKLPEAFPVHWGFDGDADSFGGKVFFVFLIPLIMYAIFWLCLLLTSKDSSNKNQHGKVFGMIIWIVPVMSLFMAGISYFGAIGKGLEMFSFLPALLGILFASMGNYMPKCKQNRTIGFKIKWTLENEENWNATHRFAGKVMFFGGLLMMLCCFLPAFWGMGAALAIVLVCVFTVYLYSYAYFKKQKKLGTYCVNTAVKPVSKPVKIVVAILIAAILVGVAVLMFTGDVVITIDYETFTVDSTYYSKTSFALDDIQTVQYIASFDGGLRISGFGSAKLELGNFENEKYKYLSYRYVGTDACVALFTKHGIIVFNQPTEEATAALYDELMEKTSK